MSSSNKNHWTEAEVKFLRDNYASIGALKTAKKLNRPLRSVQNKAHQIGAATIIQAFTPLEIQTVRDLYPTHSINTIAAKLNINYDRVRSITRKFKIKKHPKFRSMIGKITGFQKGNIPPGYKPVGTERVSEITMNHEGYIYIKVADGERWVAKHRWLWKQEHGAIPKDHVVYFVDGNPRNFDIANLAIKKRDDLMLDNSKHYLPHELRPINKVVQSLIKQVRQKNKELNNKNAKK